LNFKLLERRCDVKTMVGAVILLFVLSGPAAADVAGRGHGSGPKDGSIDIDQIDKGLPTQDPSKDQPGMTPGDKVRPPDDGKVLLPAIKKYRVELGKARFKTKRFDLSKGLDLVTLTDTKVPIPAMKEIVKGMSRKAGEIKSKEFREEMMEHIKNLGVLLKSQENNRTDRDGMAEAFNKMEKSLDQMENPTQ
jgi:hypothetical protein